jgi:hypothetical protein
MLTARKIMLSLAAALAIGVLSTPSFAGSPQTGSARVNHSDISMVKFMDKSSPKLYFLVVVIP